ncbi:MAG: hypothetical protein QMD80_04080 [archaeon]|nr:hypothetical protein [archaeon]
MEDEINELVELYHTIWTRVDQKFGNTSNDVKIAATKQIFDRILSDKESEAVNTRITDPQIKMIYALTHKFGYEPLEYIREKGFESFKTMSKADGAKIIDELVELEQQ